MQNRKARKSFANYHRRERGEKVRKIYKALKGLEMGACQERGGGLHEVPGKPFADVTSQTESCSSQHRAPALPLVSPVSADIRR